MSYSRAKKIPSFSYWNHHNSHNFSSNSTSRDSFERRIEWAFRICHWNWYLSKWWCRNHQFSNRDIFRFPDCMASFIGLEFIKVSYFTFLRVWFHLSVPYLFSNLLCKNIINIYDVELMEYYLYFYFMTYTRVVDTLWNHKTKSVTRSHTAYMIRYVCHGLRRK